MTQEPIQNIQNNLFKETPFGATKTAELDVQFALDPSFGLSKHRYGWYSNGTFFDGTFFSEGDHGTIDIETSATADDTAILRSAYPGRYVSHTVAEPGVGATIPAEHIERDSDNLVSLTHGEISIDIAEVDFDTFTSVTSLGFSFESDATYAEVRRGSGGYKKIPQEDWNIDPLDGTGPSGDIFRPEDGYIYNMPYTWYGQGAIYFAIVDTTTGETRPVHRVVPDGEPAVDTPNMPVLVAVQNNSTADPLGVQVGGMQYAVHGSANLKADEQGRSTEITRRTTGGFITNEVSETNGSIDAYSTTHAPLISLRRDLTTLTSRTALSIDITDSFVNTDSDVWVFLFDEYNDTAALTGETFETPHTRRASETRLQVDTSATAYTPSSDAVLRGLFLAGTSKKSTTFTTGDATARLPIDATLVMTAALAVGANNTDANPALMEAREEW